MRITSGGNIGINQTYPSYKLDVAGFINTDQFSGYKQAGNTILYASTTNATLAVGASAAATWMSASSTAWYNVAIGSGALATTPTNATAQHNTAIGINALTANSTGEYNIGIGENALAANTSGIFNTAIGINALVSNTTGTYNVALGNAALYSATSSSKNTAIGYAAGLLISGATGAVGGNNSLFGYNSGGALTLGGNNILLGYNAGDALTTGSNNIVLGYDIDAPSATASNQLNIGNILFGSNVNSTGTTVDSDALIGIGTSSPTTKLAIDNTNRTAAALSIDRANTTGSYSNVRLSTAGVAKWYVGMDSDLFPSADTFGIFNGDASQGISILQSSGNLGVATTSPYAKLSVTNTGSGPSFVVEDDTSPDTTPFIIDASGNVGIGISTVSNGRLELVQSSDASSGGITVRNSGLGASLRGWVNGSNVAILDAGSTGAAVLSLNSGGGLVGIGMTNPSVALDVTGDIEYTGTITDVSDERLKENITDLDGALALLAQIDGKSFNMKGSTSTEFGFIAQNVQLVLPEAVSVVDPENGYLGVSYLEFIPWLVEGIKEIASITGAFREALIAWLGSAENGIVDLFAKNLHAENVYADRGFFRELTASSTITAGQELCVGLTCVTEGELQELLNLRSLLNGSVLGATAQEDEEAAGAPPGDGQQVEAPASSPAQDESGSPEIDAAVPTTTTTTDDNQPAADGPVDELTADDITPLVEEPTGEPGSDPAPEPPVELEASNDNQPSTELPATGTD